MLTTTYSLMVLLGEQQKARGLLSSLEQHLDQETYNGFEGVDSTWLQHAYLKLVAAYSFCRERKIEQYVMPSVRELAPDAKTLFASLDFHAAYSARLVEYAHGQVRRAMKGLQVDVSTVVATMQLYCKQMMERLLLEQESLFPLAQRLLSEDEWFRIASQCLSNVRNERCKCYQLHAMKRRRQHPRSLN